MLCYVFIRPLAAEPVDSPLEPPLSERIATPEDIEAAIIDMPDQLNPEFIRLALERGDHCSAVFDGAQMVSFAWRAHSKAPHGDGLWVAFDKPFRYGYHAYTRPEYRGRHLRNLRFSDWLSYEQGYRYAIGFIETHNYASLRLFERFDNKIVGLAGYVVVFGKPFPFRSAGTRRHTFRFYRCTD